MKYIYIRYLLLCLLISCENQESEKEFYSDGSLKFEAFYLNGVKHGDVREFHKNGNIKTISTYFEGHPGDTVKGYYENGNLEFVQFKIDQDRDSIHIYDSNQTFIKSKAVVVNDTIQGWRTYYDSKGSLLEKFEFLKFEGEQFINQALFYNTDGLIESKSSYYTVEVKDTIKIGETAPIKIAYNPLISKKGNVSFVYYIDTLKTPPDAQKKEYDTLPMNLHKLSTNIKLSKPGKNYLIGHFFEEDINTVKNSKDTTLVDISFTTNRMYFNIPIYVQN